MRLSVRSSADDVARVIEAWAEGISDGSIVPESGEPLSLWGRIERIWVESREELYQTHGVSEGTPWPRYSETDERDHYRHAKAAILEIDLDALEDDRLQWGGPSRLRLSLTGQNSEYYRFESSDSSEFGTAVPYAIHHDQGIGVGPVWGGESPIPQRRLVSVGTATLLLIQDATVSYVADRLGSLTDEINSFSGSEALALVQP